MEHIIRILALIILIHFIYVLTFKKQLRYFYYLEKLEHYSSFIAKGLLYIYLFLLFCTVFSIFAFGIESYFSWLPNNLGTYTDSGFMTHKESLTYLSSLVFSIYLFICISWVLEYSKQTQHKKIIDQEMDRICKYDKFTGDIQYIINLGGEYNNFCEELWENSHKDFDTLSRLHAYEELLILVDRKIKKIKKDRPESSEYIEKIINQYNKTQKKRH